jgi:hypothetical protein
MLCAGGDVAVRWLLSFLYVEGAVWKELVRWLAARRAAPARFVMRPTSRARAWGMQGVKGLMHLGMTAATGVYTWYLFITFLMFPGMDHNELNLLGELLRIVPPPFLLAGWYGAWVVSLRAEDVLLRYRLGAGLLARLELEGVSGLGEGEAARVAVTRAFWHEQAQARLAHQRARFPQPPEPLSWRVATREATLAQRDKIGKLALLALVAQLCFLIWGVFTDDLDDARSAFFCCVVLAIALVALLVLEGVGGSGVREEERRIFALESHRITTMAELAGGLTLADPMDDDALRGALSPDGAQGGELSGVEL